MLCAHLCSVLLQTLLDDGSDGCILLAELGRHLGVVRVLHHAQEIVVHQHLRQGHNFMTLSCSNWQPTVLVVP